MLIKVFHRYYWRGYPKIRYIIIVIFFRVYFKIKFWQFPKYWWIYSKIRSLIIQNIYIFHKFYWIGYCNIIIIIIIVKILYKFYWRIYPKIRVYPKIRFIIIGFWWTIKEVIDRKLVINSIKIRLVGFNQWW